jgi:hypothetical protein
MYPQKGRGIVTGERQYIKDALYEVIAGMVAETGRAYPVIYDNGNGVRPKAPFISLSFLGGCTPGLPSYTGVDAGTGKQKLYQYVRKTMTVRAFGEGAAGLLETIKARLFFQRWRDELKRLKLVIPQARGVLEHPETVGTAIENSASFDFDLAYLRVIEEEVGFIETVEIHDGFIHTRGAEHE